ncbi:ABC transporter ATP-binding protein [Niallia endozanthoxylica]|uniref:ABC transporter ATP-binding protein n=1 Tax=Niallia endozanthoxylica TaxID=2036016 RepID=A0A5J5HWC2_9BACI|nr:ABC transporter ATP-binding protein [Niallia endozanthoxylica]KAA9026411.1 ABC transporter ATP-binding protein [Niallia endozanthoxylica]
MTEIVKLNDVTKVIKGRKIIDSISFEVHKGEVFGFLGPNGAGKTTTIRMMVGLIGITEGDIEIAGKSIKKDFERAIRHIGAIVENPEMYKFLSGYQNLIHYARMSNVISKEKIDEVVKLVGLTERIHEKVKTYSLGMRQRLGLAQSLLHEPDVLILDEPTNGLDPAGIREIRDHLRFLAKENNMAVIVSSHLLAEMEMMCDRIAIIQDGKLVNVQPVQHFMEGSEHTVAFEVDDAAGAIQVITAAHPDIEIKQMDGRILLTISKKQVPGIVTGLVNNRIDIYSVQEVTKTLEDRFLEITRGKEGHIHA